MDKKIQAEFWCVVLSVFWKNQPVNCNGNDCKRRHVGCHTWECLDQPNFLNKTLLFPND